MNETIAAPDNGIGLVCNRGAVAVITASDFALVQHRRWTANMQPSGSMMFCSGNAGRGDGIRYLHRDLLSALPGQLVDHRDGDTTNNRRSNLRLCSKAQNNANTKLSRRSTTGFKGVSKWKTRFRAYGQAYGRYQTLGVHNTAEDAARAYDAWARATFGDFACVNFARGNERAATGIPNAFHATLNRTHRENDHA